MLAGSTDEYVRDAEKQPLVNDSGYMDTSQVEPDEDIDIRAVGDEVRQGAGEPGCPTHDKQRE